MRYQKNVAGSIETWTARVGPLIILGILGLLPISAGAQCKSWVASREMVIIQPGFHSWLTIEQNGSVITGTAVGTVQKEDRKYRTPTAAGKVDGTFDGNSFSIQIYWGNDDTGVYNGKVLPSGRLDGEGYEKRSPHIRVPWHSDAVLKCMPKPVAFGSGTPVSDLFSKPKPIKSSGKAKPAPPPAPPTPPFISASQAIIPGPTAPLGTVYIGWDGGPDHPNVEVWLSMDNGAEIPAFSIGHTPQSPIWKQPKLASIALQLQRYHHYKFVLKAAGKTLSAAAFVVP